MSLDFATEYLFTAVSCSCISADGHNVSNMISRDQRLKQDGFQGERFVRTPVAIQFQFYVPINLHTVQFCPYIGRQCAKVIQLWTSNTYPLAKKEKEHCEQISNRNEAEGFRKSGTVVLSTPSKATFLNRGYKEHPGLNSTPEDANTMEAFTHGNLSCITALRISILCMLNGSIPSLSSVHIWGRPARLCSPTLSKEIFEINRKIIKSDNNNRPSAKLCVYNSSESIFDQNGNTSQQNADPITANSTTDFEQCPKEFQDPITFEKMRAPVLLPSGHTVDRTTLDKHIKSQSEMGNIATDPFTGIPFSDINKPQPNIDLKLRMDSYFLKDSESLVFTNEDAPGSLKRPIQTVVEKIKEPPSYAPIKKFKSNNFFTNSKASDHNTSLALSLNAALDQVQNNKSKTKLIRGNKIRNSNSSLYCSKCATFLSSDVVRYRLSCSHVTCFSCLKILRNDKLNCTVCSLPVVFSNVERIHV